MDIGVQSVITRGTPMMLVWSADSWVTHLKVYSINPYNWLCYSITHSFTQVLWHGVVDTLVQSTEQSCSATVSAQEMNMLWWRATLTPPILVPVTSKLVWSAQV